MQGNTLQTFFLYFAALKSSSTPLRCSIYDFCKMLLNNVWLHCQVMKPNIIAPLLPTCKKMCKSNMITCKAGQISATTVLSLDQMFETAGLDLVTLAHIGTAFRVRAEWCKQKL